MSIMIPAYLLFSGMLQQSDWLQIESTASNALFQSPIGLQHQCNSLKDVEDLVFFAAKTGTIAPLAEPISQEEVAVTEKRRAVDVG